MSSKFFKHKGFVIILTFFAILYVLFLVLPFVISPMLNSYTGKVEELINSSTGYNAKIEGLGVTTSPSLAAGVKFDDFSLYVPQSNEPFFVSKNFKLRLALIPLIFGRIQLKDINLETLNTDLIIKEDGNLLVLDYFNPQQNEEKDTNSFDTLPYGLKLSNTLPDVSVKNYKLALTDQETGKKYFLHGEKFRVSDFIFNKHIRLSTDGQIIFDNNVISNFDLNIYNNVMPKLNLNDLVFSQKDFPIDSEVEGKNEIHNFNIIKILNSINKNNLKADITANIKTFGTLANFSQRGHFRIDGLTVAVNGKQLPESYADLKFKGKKAYIDSVFFTSSDSNEKTQLIGTMSPGKNTSIDLTLKSNAKINNVIRLIDSIAQSFDINDFKTISATGEIDADFSISSDLKNVTSNGYLKVKPSSIKYGLYNILVDNITANVSLDNNNIDIKNAGFSIFGKPLKLSGKILSNAEADLKLTADNLLIKGLLAAAAQMSVLKENDFKSGTLSLVALLKGRLDSLVADVSLKISNLNILNIASGLSVLVPDANISIDTDNINIKNSYVVINNSRIDVSGTVKDYMNDKLSMNILAKGNLATAGIMSFLPADIRSMFPYKGALPLNIVITGNAKTQNMSVDLIANPTNYIQFADVNILKGKNTKIHSDMKYSSDTINFSNSGIYTGSSQLASLGGSITKVSSSPYLNLAINIPNKVSFPIWGMGKNSNISAYGSVNVTGNITDPQVKGTVNASDISVKDMDFVLTNLVANLKGKILSGSATADRFKFGNIIGTNIESDFLLKNYTDFYLTNLSADAFDGKVNGKISYIIPTTAIGFSMSGKGLNSTNAVYGASGIKNALTGTLGFNTNLTMRGITDQEIIKSMKGDVDFNIDDGRFMSIGKLENLVAAQNVQSNSILKSAISSLSTLAVVQETDKFKNITGKMTLSNGSANISKINVTGPLMSYYVHGTYNILPNTANLIILGRLDSKVVSVLGVVGQLSAEKLLSYIPKFGTATSQILQKLTEDPANENISLIPSLSSGSSAYKDFKVVMNGIVGASNSIRSFKWLSKCDTTKIDIKQDLQEAKNAVQTNINNQINDTKTKVENVKNNVNNIIQTQKQNVEAQKQSFEQTKTDIQNAKNNASQSASNLGKLFMKAVQNANKPVGE